MDPTSAPELSSGMSGYAESSAGACCGNHEHVLNIQGMKLRRINILRCLQYPCRGIIS